LLKFNKHKLLATVSPVFVVGVRWFLMCHVMFLSTNHIIWY